MEILLSSQLDLSFQPAIGKELFNHLFRKINLIILINHSYNEYNLNSQVFSQKFHRQKLIHISDLQFPE